MNKIEVIILNYNNSTDCKKCIQFLRRQDYPNLNIILVDNASSKIGERENLEKISSEFNVDLILSEENKGYSAGNNIGLKKAVMSGADWCLIINPDVELRDRAYISYMSSQFEQWPEAAVAASNIILPDGTRQNPQREPGFWEEFLWPVQVLKARLFKNFNWYLMPDRTGYCEKVSGCCFFMKADFLVDIGFLDENVFMYCEEAILAKQVRKHCRKELYIKEITANHEHFAGAKGNINKRMRMKVKSRNYYISNYSEFNTIQKILAIMENYVMSLGLHINQRFKNRVKTNEKQHKI
ncbi:glycosyltransferase [[Clostridium] symbiosum]|uniref:glycosyltransferase n=1 Tax=Clostridium symbiosum TaxID=1512 RepID=UPI001D0783B1|nr:glycosyltransferase [[Clostridium] symbiosum]MCB6607759.1 glycosyltransferase [[Clostridium] symbiosum]MCB6932620.1 glycosyltransferase [[Clostridium] symbiosum]